MSTSDSSSQVLFNEQIKLIPVIQNMKYDCLGNNSMMVDQFCLAVFNLQ